MSIVRSLIAGGLLALASALPANAAIVISIEAPGVTNTSANGSFAVETFDTATAGFQTNVNDVISGVTFAYAGVDVRPADQFGGVGGSQYAATYNGLNFPPYDASASTYKLDASSTGGPLNYFGAYFTAQDFNNEISFYKDGNLVSTFTPAVVVNATTSIGGYTSGGFINVFVNFYFTGSSSYDSILFDAAGNGTGFESDNHTVGVFVPPISGTTVDIVPEPQSWAMMVLGFGVVGATLRRRKVAVAA